MFDFQAINMAAAHNMVIQGLNAVIRHGPTVKGDKVEPFMVFCRTLIDNIHHHHTLEETFYFPVLEEKLGAGTLQGNVEQHKEFMPGLEALEEWCKKVQKGEAEYDGTVFLGLVEAFGDTMVAHLNSEIPTLDRNIIQAKFTVTELKDIGNEFVKRALASIDYYTALPYVLVCGNPETPWFPPVPTPIKWAARWWFSRRYSEAWKYGPLDLYGNKKATD
jgi:hemerythrin-like domain-containing protein